MNEKTGKRPSRGDQLHASEERPLARSETFLNTIFNHAGDAIFVHDLEGNFVDCNQQALKSLGYSKEEFLRLRVHDIDAKVPDQKDVVPWKQTAPGETFIFNGIHKRKDGSTFPVEVLVAPLKELDPPLIIAIARDATEREQAEEALKESEARFRTLVEQAGDGFELLDENGRYIDLNYATCRQLGYSRQEMLGLSIPDIDPLYSIDRYRADFESLVKQGTPITVESVHKRRDGTTFPVEITISPILLGNAWHGLSQVRDITERKEAVEALRESEERFRAIFEQAAVGVAQIETATGRFIHVNQRYCDIVGRTLEQMTATSFMAITHPDDLQADLDNMEQLKQGRIRSFSMEKRYLRPGGSLVWVNLTVSPMWLPGESPDFHIAIVEDITERKEANTLREANQRKDEFLAMLSHELRNPLAAISNSLSIIEQAEAGSQQAKKAREVIDRQVQNLSRMVDDLLEVSRITQDKIRLKRKPLELNEFARHIVDDHISLFQSKGVCLDVRFSPSEVSVVADETRLSQVVGNLLQNAAKFTGRGEGTLLSIDADMAAGQAVIRVKDSGMGMKSELIPRLFHSFMQAEGSLDRSGGGLGLGLALVKGLVELHGGNVSAFSEGPGKGSEFVVRLPILTAPTGKEGQKSKEMPVKKLRVLIIEDNAAIAETLGMMLELNGHKVAMALDGPEGIELARGFDPDIVLCDIGLPGMSGFEVAKAFRREEALRDRYLVALTGYSMPDDIKKAAEAGFDIHLAKPVFLADLNRLFAKVPTKG